MTLTDRETKEAEILRRFEPYKVNGYVGEQIERQRTLFAARAGDILANTRPSREQSAALTALEEAMMWTNKALSAHGWPLE